MPRVLFPILAVCFAMASSVTAGEPVAKFRPAAADAIAGEYIVVLADGVAHDPLTPGSSGPPVAEVAERLVATHGGTIQRVHEYALPGFSLKTTEEAARRLAADPAVRFVEQNARVEVSAVGSCYPEYQAVSESRSHVSRPAQSPETIDCDDPDPINRSGDPDPTDGIECIDNWGLDLIDGSRDREYDFSLTGQGVHVYLLDLGIDVDHPEFGTRVRIGFNAAAPDEASEAEKSDVDDCSANSHGSHMAAIIGGKTFGVAKKALLHPVKWEDVVTSEIAAARSQCEARNNAGTRDTLINGIDWILSTHNRPNGPTGPAVVNFSGGNGTNTEVRDATMALWVRRLLRAGIGFVQSAGNSTVDACDRTLAQHDDLRDGLLVVGGVDEKGPFSGAIHHRWLRETGDPSNNSTNPLIADGLCDRFGDCGSNTGSCIDLWAPAAHIVSADAVGGACRLSGTSMAAPHVTGAVALLLQRFPAASPSTVKEALLDRARAGYLQNGASGTPVLGAGSPNLLLRTAFLTTGPPIAGDDWFTTPPGMPLTISFDQLLRGDIDWDGDPLTLIGFAPDPTDPSGMEKGELVQGNQTFTFTPVGGFTGTYTFSYTVGDGTGGTDSAEVRIEVVQQPRPPVARDDCFSVTGSSTESCTFSPAGTFVDLGQSYSLLRVNDSDPDDDLDSGSVAVVDPPDFGVLGADFSNRPRYCRTAPGTEPDTFRYVIRDDFRQKGEATVTINVGEGLCPEDNDPPVPQDDALSTPFETSVSFLSTDLLANDTDPDGDALFYAGPASSPQHGDLHIDGIAPEATVYRYVPDAGFIGTDGFDYRVQDEHGAVATAHVTITVTSPSSFGGNPDFFVTTVDGKLRVLSTQLLANDSDGAVFIRAENPTNGTLSIAGIAPEATVYDFYPASGFVGEAGFEYLISPNGFEPYTRVAVTVQVSDGPPAAAFTASCAGTSCSFDASLSSDDVGIASYDWTFGDGASGTGMTSSQTYARGTYPVILTVTDTKGQTATDERMVTADGLPVASFTFSCTGLACSFDGSGSSDDDGIAAYAWAFGDGATGSGATVSHTYATSGERTATLTVTDTGGQTASAGQAVVIDFPPTACFTASCTGVTCSVDAGCSSDDIGILSYAWDFGDGATGSGQTASRTYATSGPRTVTLTVTDARNPGQSTTRQVNPVNRPPVAVNDSKSTPRNTAINVNVLANDSDPDGDPLTVSAWGQGAHGSVTKNANGTLRYAPATGYTGPDSFTYTASDGRGDTATATVSMTVTVPNDPPAARDDGWSTYFDGATSIPFSHMLANDYDPNGDALTITGYNTAGLYGTLDCSYATYCRFTPSYHFTGTTSFGYTVSDGEGGTDTATVRINVGVANGQPTPQDDLKETTRNTAFSFSRASLLGNDTDPDGDVVSVTSVWKQAAVGFGTVSCSSTKDLCTYTPATGFTGVDVLKYRVSDGIVTADARIRILVRPSTPVTLDAREDQYFFTTSGKYISYSSLLGNDYDPEGGALTIVNIDTTGLLGTLDCTTYTTGCDYWRNGNSSPTRFRYTVRDPQGNLDTTTVTLKPGNWSYNQAPVLAADQLTTARNTPLQFSIFDLMRNDYDPDNDQLNLTVAWATQNATITCTAPHYLCTYTPNTGFTGVDSFSYQTSDGTNYGSGTVTVNVTP